MHINQWEEERNYFITIDFKKKWGIILKNEGNTSKQMFQRGDRMKITDIRLRLGKGSEEGGKLKAYVDVTFDESFVVHGLKVIEGQNGLFVAMPSRRMPNGEFKDIAHPIKPELRSEITDSVIKKYEAEKETLGAAPEATPAVEVVSE